MERQRPTCTLSDGDDMSQWVNLFEGVYDEQGRPTIFKREELADVENLWQQRAALFLTPTSSIPDEFVGEGVLQVRLPIVTPTYDEWKSIPGYSNTRMWVDLLQRATGKIRWRPMDPVTITVIRRDTYFPGHTVIAGAKYLTDAYKVSSTGRRDGYLVHYFGAIVDDASRNIGAFNFNCLQVSSRAEVGMEIEIRPWRAQDGTGCRETLPNGAESVS